MASKDRDETAATTSLPPIEQAERFAGSLKDGSDAIRPLESSASPDLTLISSSDPKDGFVDEVYIEEMRESATSTRTSFFGSPKNKRKEEQSLVPAKARSTIFSRRSLTTKASKAKMSSRKVSQDLELAQDEGTSMLNGLSSLLNRNVEGDEVEVEKKLKNMKENDLAWTFANAAVRRQYLAYMVLLPVATLFNMSSTFLYGDYSHVVTCYIVTLAVMTMGVLVLHVYIQNGHDDKNVFAKGFLVSQCLNGAILLIASIVELADGSLDLNIASGALYSLRSFLLFNLTISSAVLKHENIPEIFSIGLSAFPMVAYLVACAAFWNEASFVRAQLILSDLLLFSMAGIPMLYWTSTQEQFMDHKTVELLLKNEENENKRDNNIEILLHLLPSDTVHGFLSDKTEMVEDFSDCTILFMKVIGLSDLSKRINTVDMVMLFNVFVCRCDNLTKEHNVEKIRTDFGVYLVASGLPKPNDDHAENMAKMAVSLVDTVSGFKEDMGVELTFKIGMSSGRCVAGVIGTSRYQYDLIGDCVNVAARMCSSCPNGKIQLTCDMHEILKDSSLFGNSFESGGIKKIKGKGNMEVFYLLQKGVSNLLKVHKNAEFMAGEFDGKNGSDSSPDTSITSSGNDPSPLQNSRRMNGEQKKTKRISYRFSGKKDGGSTESTEVAAMRNKSQQIARKPQQKDKRSDSLIMLTDLMNKQTEPSGGTKRKASIFSVNNDEIAAADRFHTLTAKKANDLFFVWPLILALLCLFFKIQELPYDDCDANREKNKIKSVVWQAVILPSFLFLIAYFQRGRTQEPMSKHAKQDSDEVTTILSVDGDEAGGVLASSGSFRNASFRDSRNLSQRELKAKRSSSAVLLGKDIDHLISSGIPSIGDGSSSSSKDEKVSARHSTMYRAVGLVLAVSLMASFCSLCFRPSAVLFLWWVYVAHSYYLVFGIHSTCMMILFSVTSVLLFVASHLLTIEMNWDETIMITEADSCTASYWSNVTSMKQSDGVFSEEGHDWLLSFAVQQLVPMIILSMLTFYSTNKRLTLSYTHFRTQLVRGTSLDASSTKTRNILEKCTPPHFLDTFRKNQLPTVSGLGTMLFADLVDFTPFSATRTPMELADCLNEMYKLFDELADKHRVDKIKTIGDCYVACAGLITQIADHAEVMCKLACGLQQAIDDLNEIFCTKPDDAILSVRIGLHTGTFVGGVIGSEKFGLDMWGREVEIAQKMESDGVPDRIMISDATHKEAKRSKQLLFESHRYIPLFVDEWDSYWAGVPEINSFDGVLDESNSAIYYKSLAVYAFQSEDGFTFNKSWGDDVHVKEDWLIIGETSSNLNDVYGNEKEFFKNNYKAAPEVGAHQYRKQQPCRAARAKVSLTCPDGTSISEGDFVVQNIGKSGYYKIAGDTFRNQYLVDAQDPIALTLGSIPAESVSSQMRTWLITQDCQADRVLSLKDVDKNAAKDMNKALKIGALRTGKEAQDELKALLAATSGDATAAADSPVSLEQLKQKQKSGFSNSRISVLSRKASRGSNKVAPIPGTSGSGRRASALPALRRVYSKSNRRSSQGKGAKAGVGIPLLEE